MNLVAFPLLLPLLTAMGLLACGRRPALRDGVALASGVVQLGVASVLLWRAGVHGIQVLAVGRWGAPYGVVWVVDVLSGLMLVLTALTLLAGMAYARVEVPSRMTHPLRLPLLQFLAAGINLSFITGDLFNLFVAFEILLVASYALLTLEADDWDVKQAFPYLALNVLGSTLFFCAAGLTYGLLGTLNFADLARRAPELAGDPRLTVLVVLLLAVFSLKAGLFPLYHWLPHSYPTLATPVAAVFAGLLTKVGIYVLIRMLATVFPHDLTGVHALVAWGSGATMLLGVMGALSRNTIRGILSFHILSQVAFMTLALGFFTPLSLTAAVFYVVHHIVVKGSLFLIGGVAARINGSDDLDRMGGLWRAAPWLGVLFLAQGLSLAGLPPLSGFWGKYLIVVEGLGRGEYLLVAASLAASVLTLLSMLKIWLAAFWREDAGVTVDPGDARGRGMAAVCAGLATVSVGIGLGAGPMFQLARKAADQVMDTRGYQEAVFAVKGKEARP